MNLKEFLSQFDIGAAPTLPQTMLHHYTSVSGLHGILHSNSLWATEQRFSNDSKEFQHAIDVALEIINERIQDEDLSDIEKKVYSHIKAAYSTFNQPYNFWFIVSLSEKPNLLSQWRAYGGAAGYSIGFNVEKLYELSRDTKFKLIRCIYDLDTQRSLMLELIDETIDNFQSVDLIPDLVSRSRPNPILEFRKNLFRLAAVFKHPSFNEEAEWRLLGANKKGIKVRASETSLIPYVELPFGDAYPIDEIIVGPHENKILAESSLTYLVDLKKVQCTVQVTDCPYKT